MNNLTNEQIKQIIDDAPDGATHYATCVNEYIMQTDKGVMVYENGEWDYEIVSYLGVRCLSDLSEILVLRERVAVLEQGGWVSVDERLPEYGAPVLVFVPETDAEESYITTDLMDKDYEYWLLVSDNYNHAQAVGRVTDNDIIPTGIAPYTHWQPLPLPPKENTNDN